MRDPDEGIDADGCIVTGARRDRVASRYEPILTEAADAAATTAGTSFEGLYLYGSVATGQARAPGSDVDLLALVDDATTTRSGIAGVATELSVRHVGIAREVAIAVMDLESLAAPGPDGAANRAFLRHYCVHIAGPDHARAFQAAKATPSLAFAFNSNARDRLAAIRQRSEAVDDPALLAELATQASRKLLLVAASYASALRGAWTTDRATGAVWLSQERPDHAFALRRATSMIDEPVALDRDALDRFLDAATQVVDGFEAEVGAATGPVRATERRAAARPEAPAVSPRSPDDPATHRSFA